MSVAPSEQFTPTASGFACATDHQKASMVWPESVRPDLSTIVTEITSGTRARPASENTSSIATSAAFAFKVSKMVSRRSRSTPPSSRPSTCSR